MQQSPAGDGGWRRRGRQAQSQLPRQVVGVAQRARQRRVRKAQPARRLRAAAGATRRRPPRRARDLRKQVVLSPCQVYAFRLSCEVAVVLPPGPHTGIRRVARTICELGCCCQ